MIKINRQQLKTDPVYAEFLKYVVGNHQVAKHTERVLRKNKHIKGFCEEATHYAEIDKFLISYDVASWRKEPNGVSVKVDSITFYDNREEYEAARRKGLNSTVHADGANLN